MAIIKVRIKEISRHYSFFGEPIAAVKSPDVFLLSKNPRCKIEYALPPSIDLKLDEANNVTVAYVHGFQFTTKYRAVLFI